MTQSSRSSVNPQQFAEMLAAARNGDADAVGWLLEQNRDYLLFIANQDLDRGTLRKMGASDLVQESIAHAHHHFDRFAGESLDDLLAWLRGILRNDAKHWQRHFMGTEKRNSEKDLQASSLSRLGLAPRDPEATPHTHAVAEEEEKLLNLAMKQLPENYQTVIRLRNWDDLSFKQIGERMSCSSEAARKLWTRAINQLQELLNQWQSRGE